MLGRLVFYCVSRKSESGDSDFSEVCRNLSHIRFDVQSCGVLIYVCEHFIVTK